MKLTMRGNGLGLGLGPGKKIEFVFGVFQD